LVPVIAEKIPLEELEDGGCFLQSPFWALQKQTFGWKPLAVRWKRGEEAGTLLVLIRSLLPGISLAYVPAGPASGAGSEDRETFLIDLSRELRGVLPLGTFFIRFDPPEYGAGSEPAPGYGRPLVKAPMDIQPPDTVVLPLDRSPEELLAGMHKKTRYNIRLAVKKGVTTEVCGRESLPQWYELYRVTAERDRIAIHGFDYYDHLFEILETSPSEAAKVRLLLARSPEGELLAGIIVLLNGDEAVYLYGASSNENRHLMPAYALQWRAMELASEAGCCEYDLFGIPPTEDPEHPMHGLYRFKTGFGGEVRHRPGAWDYPYSRLFYTLYRGMEGARRFYYKTWKKRK